jgi:hypothetical protein
MPRFAHLPRPWIGALVGGDSGSFRMTPSCAARLGAQLSRMARDTGGSVLLTTSARTRAECSRLIQRSLDCPAHLHFWDSPSENPYLGIVALADRFVVTGESASMIAEAANTTKPIELFDLDERLISRLLTRWLPALGLGWTFRMGARSGYWTPPRNMRRLHEVLRSRGHIGDKTDAEPNARSIRPIEWDLARTIGRIAQLCAPEALDAPRPATQSGAFANQAV